MKCLYFSLFCYVSFTLFCFSLCQVSAQAPTRAKIVFASTRNGNHGNAEIYVMNTDGSQQIRLTHYAGDDTDPIWSPNGKHIAFVSDREHKGLYDIYLMDADGENIRRAFEDLEYRTAPAWVAGWKTNRLPHAFTRTGLGRCTPKHSVAVRQNELPNPEGA